MSQALRYVALKLSKLHPEDRQWFVEQLPSSVKDAVNSFIEDADRFDAIDTTHIVQQWGAEQGIAEVGMTDSDRIAMVRCINRAGLEAVKAAIDVLPTVLKANFLQLKPWLWRDDYLKSCHHPERKQLQQLMQSELPVGEKLAESVFVAVYDQLKDHCTQSSFERLLNGNSRPRSFRLWRGRAS